MRPDTLPRKIAGVSLQVPLYVDEETTDELVRRVDARIQQIQAQGGRIDSQAFALLAALSFAQELQQLEDDRRQDQEELLKSLRKVTEALRALARDFHIA